MLSDGRNMDKISWVVVNDVAVRRQEYENTLSIWSDTSLSVAERDDQVFADLSNQDVPDAQQAPTYQGLDPIAGPMTNEELRSHVAQHAVAMLFDAFNQTVQNNQRLARNIENTLATTNFAPDNLSAFGPVRRIGEILGHADVFARKYRVDIGLDAELSLILYFILRVRILKTTPSAKLVNLVSVHRIFERIPTAMRAYRPKRSVIFMIDNVPCEKSTFNNPQPTATVPRHVVGSRGQIRLAGSSIQGDTQSTPSTNNTMVSQRPTVASGAATILEDQQFSDRKMFSQQEEGMQVVEYYPGDSPPALLNRINNIRHLPASLPPIQNYIVEEQDERYTREDAQMVWDKSSDRVLGLEKITDDDVGFLLETFPEKVIYTLSKVNTLQLSAVLQVSINTRLDSLKRWCMEHRNTAGDWSQRVRRKVVFPSIWLNNPRAKIAMDLINIATHSEKTVRDALTRIAAAILEDGSPLPDEEILDWNVPENITIKDYRYTARKVDDKMAQLEGRVQDRDALAQSLTDARKEIRDLRQRQREGTTDNEEAQIAALYAFGVSGTESHMMRNGYKKKLSQIFNLDEKSIERIVSHSRTDDWHDAFLGHVTAGDGQSKRQNRKDARSALTNMSAYANEPDQEDLPPRSPLVYIASPLDQLFANEEAD